MVVRLRYLVNFNRGVNARIVFLPLHELFFSLHNSDIEIKLFHRGTIKQTLCTTKTLGAILQRSVVGRFQRLPQ